MAAITDINIVSLKSIYVFKMADLSKLRGIQITEETAAEKGKRHCLFECFHLWTGLNGKRSL